MGKYPRTTKTLARGIRSVIPAPAPIHTHASSLRAVGAAPPTWPTSSAMFNRWAMESGYQNWAHHPEAQPIRIDYVLVHRRDSAPLRIAGHGRFGTRHRTDDLFASDHWGLWVDLAIA